MQSHFRYCGLRSQSMRIAGCGVWICRYRLAYVAVLRGTPHTVVNPARATRYHIAVCITDKNINNT